MVFSEVPDMSARNPELANFDVMKRPRLAEWTIAWTNFRNDRTIQLVTIGTVAEVLEIPRTLAGRLTGLSQLPLADLRNPIWMAIVVDLVRSVPGHKFLGTWVDFDCF